MKTNWIDPPAKRNAAVNAIGAFHLAAFGTVIAFVLML